MKQAIAVSKQYNSRLTSNPNLQTNSTEQMQKGLTGLGKFVIGADPFRVKIAGKLFSILFYLGFAVGILCVTFAILITVVPGTSAEDQGKLEIVQANNKWLYNNKQSMMKQQNIKIDIQNNSSQRAISSSQLNLQSYLQNELSQVSSLFINSSYFQSDDLSIGEDNKYCLKVKVESKTIKNFQKNMKNCKGDSNSIQILQKQKKTLSFEDMIKMNLCLSNESCKNVCQQNKGVLHQSLTNTEDNIHNILPKHFDLTINTCTANFSVSELCLVSHFNQSSNSIDSILKGCYENSSSERYDFSQNVESFKVIIRDEEDPYLAALKISNSYEISNELLQPTQKQQSAQVLYILASFIFLMMIILLIIIRVKQNRSESFTKISKISTLAPPLPQSV